MIDKKRVVKRDVMSKNSFTVIIPTKDKHPRLKAVLLSLKYQSCGDFATIIINDGGRPLDEMVSELDYPYPLMVVDRENSGRAASRNIGAEMATSDYLIFLDDDCMVKPDFIEKKLEKSAQMGPKSVAHGVIYNFSYLKFFKDPFNRVLYDELGSMKTDSLESETFSYEEIASFDKLLKRRIKTTRLEKAIIKILKEDMGMLKWLCSVGGNITISRAFFNEVGGFDEEFGRNWGSEDLELGYRLLKEEAHFILEEDTPVYHLDHYRQGSAPLLAKAFDYFYQKHCDDNIKMVYELFFKEQRSIDEVYRALKKELL